MAADAEKEGNRMSLIRSRLIDKALQVGERHLLIDTKTLEGGQLKQSAINFNCRYVVQAFDVSGRWVEEGYYRTLEAAQVVFHHAELCGTSTIHTLLTVQAWAKEEKERLI